MPPLPTGNSLAEARKQSISPGIIMPCMSMRSYMLDAVAISAARPAAAGIG
jgi:hypothetical protein